MTDIDDSTVEHFNDVVTRVGGTYCIHMRGHYVTTIGRENESLGVTVHMTEDEARDLCIGLKDALHEVGRVR